MLGNFLNLTLKTISTGTELHECSRLKKSWSLGYEDIKC